MDKNEKNFNKANKLADKCFKLQSKVDDLYHKVWELSEDVGMELNEELREREGI